MELYMIVYSDYDSEGEINSTYCYANSNQEAEEKFHIKRKGSKVIKTAPVSQKFVSPGVYVTEVDRTTMFIDWQANRQMVGTMI